LELPIFQTPPPPTPNRGEILLAARTYKTKSHAHWHCHEEAPATDF
jgi:hypothetical protein